jgi:enediyne biosynthesis protein E4
VVVGDYDNDGWPDLYESNFGKNRKDPSMSRDELKEKASDIAEQVAAALF